jgi:glycosyltransferase involved in cell wall biosynthesis
MRIVHLSKNDVQGGAARAAYRLYKGLQEIGHDSSMLVASRITDDRNVMTFKKPMDLMNLARRGIRQVRLSRAFAKYTASRPSGYELFSDERSFFASTLLDQIPACDVINLHWISGFVDYQSFLTQIPISTPVVWTFHDMNAFTGGCHYNLGCGNYLHQCGKCPQLGSSEATDLSYFIWQRKQRIFSRVPTSRLRIVTPSKWLANEVAHSPILRRFSAAVIPNGLSVEDFAPRPREGMRNLLGIPQGARVLLFVAEEISNRRKGFALLIEALSQCARQIPNLMLLSLGLSKPEIQLEIPWLHIGSVNNDRFLSMVYSAADLFAICSLQDNLPNTVLEAMACGIPVVGHAVGGIPDMVRNGVNGFTVPPNDIGALASAISDALNSTERCAEMGANARRIAVEEYSLELQARRYAELYATLLGDTHVDQGLVPR